MMTLMKPFWLAVIEGLDSLPSTPNLGHQYGPLVTQAIIILSVGLGIGIVCILYVRYSHRSHRHRSSSSSEPPLASSGRHAGRRRRVRRTEHRPRMPTLSETGGLPPMRPEDPTNPTP